MKHEDLKWLVLPSDENAIDELLILATKGNCRMPYFFWYQDAFIKLKELGKVTIEDGRVNALDKDDVIWKIMWSELRSTSGQLKYFT